MEKQSMHVSCEENSVDSSRVKMPTDSIYKRICRYNLFASKADDDAQPFEDRAMEIKQQQYSTWLYILFLAVSMYVLTYTVLVKPERYSVTVTGITPELYHQLHLEHPNTLSCPCSKTATPYETFVTHTFTFHPVCSSIFVHEEWIRALYLEDASSYGVGDFRTTAFSQFRLLATLCWLSQDALSQGKTDLDKKELISSNVLLSAEVFSKVNAAIQLFKIDVASELLSLVKYLRATTRVNYYVSALNTNLLVQLSCKEQVCVLLRKEVFISNALNDSQAGKTIDCAGHNPVTITGFRRNPNCKKLTCHQQVYVPEGDIERVEGFFTACTPLEAILHSTLDCLYNVTCVELLGSYFPALANVQYNSSEAVLPSASFGKSVNDLLSQLFVDGWSTTVDYSAYFLNCAPSSCTYEGTEETSVSFTIARFVGLNGGLIIVLRLLVPFLVKLIMQLHRCFCPGNRDSRNCLSCRAIVDRLRQCAQLLRRTNLFAKSDRRTENDLKQQRTSTRIYLILLAGTFFVLFTSVTWGTVTHTTTSSAPTLSAYYELHTKYSATLQCPCANTLVPYASFVDANPLLHQICTSDLVSDQWIALLRDATTGYISPDWRNLAASHFYSLASLCELAHTTATDAVQRFRTQAIAASVVLPATELNEQLSATLHLLIQSTVKSFGLATKTLRTFAQVDQPYSGPTTNLKFHSIEDNLLGAFTTDAANNSLSSNITFRLNGPRLANATSPHCICATNPDCRIPLGIYDTDQGWSLKPTFIHRYTAPSLLAGCSVTDALTHSSFECYYSDCFSVLKNHSQAAYVYNVERPQWVDARPLVYDPVHSRFPPKASIASIVEAMMIEQWQLTISYANFYKTCAPLYCTYSTKGRPRIAHAMVTLIPLLGGLILSLRLVVSGLVKLWFFAFRRDNQRQQGEDTQRRTVCGTVKNYNIFATQDFGRNIDRTTVKRLGVWSTRLYILVFALGFGAMSVYLLTQPRLVTVTYMNPTLDLYAKLTQRHGDRLESECARIAVKHDEIMDMSVVLHQICMSSFVSNGNRLTLTPSLADYAPNDYRRFLPAHLQFLQGLCQLAQEAVDIAMVQVFSSPLVSAKPLTEADLSARLSATVSQSQFNARRTFTRLRLLIRNVNHGNGIVSTYGSNFEYVIRSHANVSVYAHTRAKLYDKNCSCAVDPGCTSEARFYVANSTPTDPIVGLRMGCTPSESFLASTLQCFYDRSCVRLLGEYASGKPDAFQPLSAAIGEPSRFPINTTVAELIDNLFIERWTSSINYAAYFRQCAPLTCSFSAVQKRHVLELVIILLALQGGFTVILTWVCPKIVGLMNRMYQCRGTQMNVVRPGQEEITSTSSPNVGAETLRPSRTVSARHLLKICSIALLLLLTTAGLIVFSMKIKPLEKQHVPLPTSPTLNIPKTATFHTTAPSTETSSETTTMTTEIGSVPACPLTFSQLSFNASRSSTSTFAIGDFNDDNQPDLVIIHERNRTIHVMFGNDEANFVAGVTHPLHVIIRVNEIVVADFNNDNHSDLIISSVSSKGAILLVGRGNGQFDLSTKHVILDQGVISDIAVGYLNGDRYIDYVITAATENTVHVFIGQGEQLFQAHWKFFLGINHYPTRIVLGDFNQDRRLDIAVLNTYARSIALLLGQGNGDFHAPQTSSTGGGHDPEHFVAGDFNNDDKLDVIVSYHSSASLLILFGRGDGTFDDSRRFTAGNHPSFGQFFSAHFNRDRHLDIVFANRKGVTLLLGDGRGNFHEQMLFSPTQELRHEWFAIHDLNHDAYDDMVYLDRQSEFTRILLDVCK